MSQLTYYDSTQSSAPVLTGVAGSLATVLDAILINGYGSVAAAGWTTTFTAANKRIYRPSAGSRFYLRVLDDGSLTGGARDACIRGYETVSDIDTGTSPFPTVAQRSDANSAVRKSTTADSTARAWWAYADGRTLYLEIATGDSGTSTLGMMFGDIYSFVSSDIYNCMIVAGYGASTLSAVSLPSAGWGYWPQTSSAQAVAQHYIVRKAIGTGGSEPAGKAPLPVNVSAVAQVGNITFPNPSDSKLWMSRVYVYDTTSSNIRGYLRGLYIPQHAISNFIVGDTVTGVGAMATKTFRFGSKANCTGSASMYMYETSDTVDTNS